MKSLCLVVLVAIAVLGVGIAILQPRSLHTSLSATQRMTTPATDLQPLREYLLGVSNLTYSCDGATRIGNTHDGCCVWCEGVFPTDQGCTVISFGHANDDDFELQVTKKGCQVYEYTAEVWGTDGWRAKEHQIHFKKIGLANSEGYIPGVGATDTLDDFGPFRQSNISGWRAVRIDILGREWLSLSDAPYDILNTIDILIVKFYMVDDNQILVADLPARVALLQRLRNMFYVYHSRGNNCFSGRLPDGSPSRRPYPMAPGFFIPAYIELSFIRKSRISGTPAAPFNAHTELDNCQSAGSEDALFPIPAASPIARAT